MVAQRSLWKTNERNKHCNRNKNIENTTNDTTRNDCDNWAHTEPHIHTDMYNKFSNNKVKK